MVYFGFKINYYNFFLNIKIKKIYRANKQSSYWVVARLTTGTFTIYLKLKLLNKLGCIFPIIISKLIKSEPTQPILTLHYSFLNLTAFKLKFIFPLYFRGKKKTPKITEELFF